MPLRRGTRGRRGARPHRSRQGAVGSLRARPPPRARQRLPARDRPEVRYRRHRQRRRKSIWRVPELDIDLDHRRSRSSIAGRAKIESLAGPWTLNFRTFEQRDDQDACSSPSPCRASCRAAWRARCRSSPASRASTCRYGARRRLDLSNTGEILSGTIGIDAAPGQVVLPWLAATPLHDRRRRTVACPTTAPRAASRSRPPCWSGATAACSSPAASRTPQQGARRPGLGLRLQVGRRLDRRRAAACCSS